MVKVQDLKDKLNLKLICGEKGLDKEICGCYIGDLLSFVMSRISENYVWLTVMGNINSIAVASLRDIPCIILVENSSLDCDAKDKAENENIAVLSSEKASFDLSIEIAKLLSRAD